MGLKRQNERMPGKLAVIYARYSSSNQRDVSIEQQVNACRKYADANGYEVVKVYADHAMTGTNDNRPEFRQMIRDSESGAFDFVIVYTLDRFSRNKYDSAIHKHTLKENGVSVLSAMENIQDGPVGVLMESVLEGFAEYYSRELSQKVKRGMASNAEKCMTLGPHPLGYTRGPDGRYAIVPAEAEIVREIFNRVAAAEPFADIFRDLNARGIRTKSGAEWNRCSLTTLIHNEKYIGVYQHSGYRNENGIPPIVTKELFEKVQEYCRTKPKARHSPTKRRRDAGTYLLTGKAYCGECKSPMVGISGTSKTGALHFYYNCKTHRADISACRKKAIPRDWAEEQVCRQLRLIISRPEVTAALVDATMDYLKQSRDTEEINTLTALLKQVTIEKENTLKAIRAGVYASSVQQMLQELEDEESALRGKISLAQDRIKADITREDVIAFVESFQDGDIHDKAYQEQLFDAFLVRAYFYDDKLVVVFNYTGKGTEEIEVPFNIDEVEDKAVDVLEVQEDCESSYNVCGCPPNPCKSSLQGFFFLIIRRQSGSPAARTARLKTDVFSDRLIL